MCGWNCRAYKQFYPSRLSNFHGHNFLKPVEWPIAAKNKSSSSLVNDEGATHGRKTYFYNSTGAIAR
jgi:hypothetical protein